MYMYVYTYIHIYMTILLAGDISEALTYYRAANEIHNGALKLEKKIAKLEGMLEQILEKRLVYVCVYIYIYTRMCTCVNIYIYMYIYIYYLDVGGHA